MLPPGSRNGRSVFLPEVELVSGPRAPWTSGGQETLPADGSEIYDPEGAARLMEKELA